MLVASPTQSPVPEQGFIVLAANSDWLHCIFHLSLGDDGINDIYDCCLVEKGDASIF